ncbi:hypothetical protein NIES4102_26010 [Chondrocystis sp. NIES-4102]|nr:hypothetical protein NIES4102_26010 [Chondrocystis sp. NIES-4102]
MIRIGTYYQVKNILVSTQNTLTIFKTNLLLNTKAKQLVIDRCCNLSYLLTVKLNLFSFKVFRTISNSNCLKQIVLLVMKISLGIIKNLT